MDEFTAITTRPDCTNPRTLTEPHAIMRWFMQRMRNEGFRDVEIANVMQISRQRVGQILGKQALDKVPDTAATSEHATVLLEHADAAARLPSTLKAWRKRHRLTLQQAADRLKVRRAETVNMWELGKRSPHRPIDILRHLEELDLANEA